MVYATNLSSGVEVADARSRLVHYAGLLLGEQVVHGRPALCRAVGDGGVVVEPSTGQRVDCHVLADPVALLLLAYGRTGQWRPIGRGQMMTWGTKPWLAFRFMSFFSNP